MNQQLLYVYAIVSNNGWMVSARWMGCFAAAHVKGGVHAVTSNHYVPSFTAVAED